MQSYQAVSHSSCALVGFTTGCCIGSPSECHVSVVVNQYCYCEQSCHYHGYCCDDINDIQCPDGESSKIYQKWLV